MPPFWQTQALSARPLLTKASGYSFYLCEKIPKQHSLDVDDERKEENWRESPTNLQQHGNRFVVENVFSLTCKISCDCFFFLYVIYAVANHLQTYSHLMGSNNPHNSFLCDERTHSHDWQLLISNGVNQTLPCFGPQPSTADRV